MSEDSNPYQSPEAPIVPENTKSGVLTGVMLSFLKEASPWLRFMGIVGYIGFGIICLFAVISLITVIAIGGIPFDGFEALGAAAGVIIFILFGLFAVLAFFPAHFTYRFGTCIRNYINSESPAELETAFKNNKSFWLFCGIVTIIYLAFSVFGLPGIIAALASVASFL